MALAGRKFRVMLVGMVAAFLVLASSAAAQVGEAEADEGCANPQVVETFSGTENQRTPQFEITSDTFRLTYNIEMTGPNSFPVFGTDVLGENGQPIGTDQRSFLTFEEDSILAGPGVFALKIRASDVNYEITVKDCTGAGNGGNGNGGNGGSATDQYNQGDDDRDRVRQLGDSAQYDQYNQQRQKVINIPNKSLPHSGGFPPLLAIGFLIVAGGGLGASILRRRF